MDSIIQLDGVGKTFGGRRVLDGIDWEVRKGQNWAVLGLNGSGKTTLLRIATGRLWPRRSDEDRERPSPSARRCDCW